LARNEATLSAERARLKALRGALDEAKGSNRALLEAQAAWREDADRGAWDEV